MHRSLAKQDKIKEITLLNRNSIRNNYPSLKRHSSTLREIKTPHSSTNPAIAIQDADFYMFLYILYIFCILYITYYILYIFTYFISLVYVLQFNTRIFICFYIFYINFVYYILYITYFIYYIFLYIL